MFFVHADPCKFPIIAHQYTRQFAFNVRCLSSYWGPFPHSSMCNGPLVLTNGFADEEWNILFFNQLKVWGQNTFERLKSSYFTSIFGIAPNPLALCVKREEVQYQNMNTSVQHLMSCVQGLHEAQIVSMNRWIQQPTLDTKILPNTLRNSLHTLVHDYLRLLSRTALLS